MNFKKIEKHNIIDIVRNESLLYFTKEDLVKIVNNGRKNGMLYYTYDIENTLQELVNDGILLANYIPIKKVREYNFHKSFGYKSLAVYNLI